MINQSLASFSLDCDSHCLQTPVTGLAEEDGSASVLSVPHVSSCWWGGRKPWYPSILALCGGNEQ